MTDEFTLDGKNELTNNCNNILMVREMGIEESRDSCEYTEEYGRLSSRRQIIRNFHTHAT